MDHNLLRNWNPGLKFWIENLNRKSRPNFQTEVPDWNSGPKFETEILNQNLGPKVRTESLNWKSSPSFIGSFIHALILKYLEIPDYLKNPKMYSKGSKKRNSKR